MTEDRAEQLVLDALQAGKIRPYQRSDWVARLVTDPAAEAELAAIPRSSAVPVDPIGYGSKYENWETDPWAVLDAREPDLELRCQLARKPLARVWLNAPDGETWLRHERHPSAVHYTLGDQHLLREYANRERDVIPVYCPDHGRALVPALWVEDEARSTRRVGNVQCTDPQPVYTRGT